MSKAGTSLPGKQIKNSIFGGGIALAAYCLFQFPAALLVHREILGCEMIYPMVCVSAALASFLGCGFCVWRGEKGNVLSAAAVIVVFLTLTVATGILTSGIHTANAGLTGVGGSMTAGGLVAAVVGSLTQRNSRGLHNKTRKRRGG